MTPRLYNKSMLGDLDLNGWVKALSDQVSTTIDGDLGRAEDMLVSQAHVLDAIFGDLARRAITSKYIKQFEVYLKLGLRAQSQARATWETLSALKNPPVVYAKQANIAQLQQVNNGVPPTNNEIPRTRQNENTPTQLSGDTHELLPDTRASSDESRIDSPLETVGEINRTKVRRG